MSEANNLLENLTDEEIALYSGNTRIEEPIVVNETRVVRVPESLRRIAVQYDHNAEIVTFDCPRYWDGNDLTEMYIYINYQRVDRNKGRYLADNVRVDESNENLIHFDWKITSDISLIKGTIAFLVCAVKTNEDGNEEVHWNSELNTEMYVSEGLECTDVVLDEYPDNDDTDYEKIELYNRLRKHIAMLSSIYRETIILHYYDNLSVKQISLIMRSLKTKACRKYCISAYLSTNWKG